MPHLNKEGVGKKIVNGCPHKEGLWKCKRLDLEIFE